MTTTATNFAAALAATRLPWVRQITTASLPGTKVRIRLAKIPTRPVASLVLPAGLISPDGMAIVADRDTVPEALAALAKKLKALRDDIDDALAAIAPAIPAPPARPTCALCGTDADAPMLERLILTPATVHAACSAVSDHTPEPGDAIDRLPDFVEAYLPDAPEGSLRHTTALAALARDYPGILAINAALKAAQPSK